LSDTHRQANIAVDQNTNAIYFTFHPAAKHIENELFPTSKGFVPVPCGRPT
jgi:hypothetical protein